MDDIDISVSGQEMMGSSEIMQALTMFQSFYSKERTPDIGGHDECLQVLT